MLIDWHSHHTAPEVAEKVAQAGGPSQRTDPQDSIDFGKRVGDMDDAGIDVQIAVCYTHLTLPTILLV